MEPDSAPTEALPLLARLYRERRSGLLSVGPEEAPVLVLLRDGHVVGVGPVAPPEPARRPAMPGPDDSAHLRLERVLVEVGLRPRPKPAPTAAAPPADDPRERLVRLLADRSAVASFTEGTDAAPDMLETAGATEPLILEAVQALRDPEAVHTALGDLDQLLALTTGLAEERTLTLTEGYILSRVDGASSAREVLQLVPLDAEETERTLLGLLLTGRLEYRPVPARPARRRLEPVAPPAPAEPEPVAEGAAAADEAVSPTQEDFPLVSLVEDATPAPEAQLDPETLERKREIAEVFQSLHSKNHFEMLGVEPGCADADVKRAYTALVRRFHPDAQGDPRYDDMHDFLAAILIRAREALEVLETASSRAQYEARSGIVRRPRVVAPPPEARPAARPADDWPFAPSPLAPPRASAPPPHAPSPPAAAAPETEYVAPEDILFRARLLLQQLRYWDVIQILESRDTQEWPRRAQHMGRILLAKAYAANPNPKWVRRALEYLDEVVREDPTNVAAHYELGLLYKQVGQPARAQASFRRVLELKPGHREAAAELGLDAGPSPGGGLQKLKRLFGRGKAS